MDGYRPNRDFETVVRMAAADEVDTEVGFSSTLMPGWLAPGSPRDRDENPKLHPSCRGIEPTRLGGSRR